MSNYRYGFKNATSLLIGESSRCSTIFLKRYLVSEIETPSDLSKSRIALSRCYAFSLPFL